MKAGDIVRVTNEYIFGHAEIGVMQGTLFAVVAIVSSGVVVACKGRVSRHLVLWTEEFEHIGELAQLLYKQENPTWQEPTLLE